MQQARPGPGVAADADFGKAGHAGQSDDSPGTERHDPVKARAAGDGVKPFARAAELERIIARPTGQQIIARTTGQKIVAVAAVRADIANPDFDAGVPGIAPDRIVFGPPRIVSSPEPALESSI